jgi:hypothetical protein
MSGIHQAAAQRGERARILLGAIRRDDQRCRRFVDAWKAERGSSWL